MISLRSILILLVIIVALQLIASLNSWYYRFTWFDMPMHFLGGFWSALIFIYLNSRFNNADSQKLWFFVVLTLSFVSLVGVLWELSEYLWNAITLNANQYFIDLAQAGLAQNGLRDTLGDLLFDLIGGLGFFVFSVILKSREVFGKSPYQSR